MRRLLTKTLVSAIAVATAPNPAFAEQKLALLNSEFTGQPKPLVKRCPIRRLTSPLFQELQREAL